MRNLNKQKGIVTVLLIILIGFSVMVSTGVVATKMVGQRNASVAAHAQTNSELMGWAGVAAFRHYLLERGGLTLANITDLSGQEIVLFYDANKKEISVNNIDITGCLDEGQPCSLSADIRSNSLSARSATTIEAVYELAVVDGQVVAVDQTGSFNFGGNTSFSESTVIDAEVPGSNAIINVDGDLSLNLGFKTKNLSTLTINATGDVYIDCGAQNCGSAIINVTTKGKITLLNGSNFGDMKALGTVTLRVGAKAKNIRTAGKVTLESGSAAGDIESKSDVILSGWSTAKNITAEGKVTLSSSQADNVVANGSVSMNTGAKATSVTTLQYLYMMTNAYVDNDVIARGDSTTTQNSTVYLSSVAKVRGSIYAEGDIRLIATSKVGHAYASGSVRGLGEGPNTENSTTAADKAEALVPVQVNVADIEAIVNDQSNFDTRVDVTAYKHEANYIFSRGTGVSRVFLNNLKNKDNSQTYLYEPNGQYAVDANGKKFISNDGFALGKYKLNGSVYTGAICLTVSKGECTSDIIGYLPRIAVGSSFGINDSKSYVSISNTWYIRSLSDSSPVSNASLAPGIMYFDGNLEIAGHANLQADSQSNSFTNSFLADGYINAIAFSPRIYSPYNVTREGQESLICNRRLKDFRGADLTPSDTIPKTLSDTYLVPTNLCKNDTQFAYNMHKTADGEQDHVTIDGEPIEKLDLGNVALMANGTIRVGACAQIFGDVLARKRFEGSAACGITNNPNAVTGNISTQNKDTNLLTTFGHGTNLVIPAPDQNNGGQDGNGNGLRVNSAELKWARYK